jgi:hypothetical protein
MAEALAKRDRPRVCEARRPFPPTRNPCRFLGRRLKRWQNLDEWQLLGLPLARLGSVGD